MTTHKHLFFLGAGAIAEAMIKGIVGAHVVSAEQIVVSNRRNGARLEELSGRYGVRVSRDRLAEIAEADAVVLAMKPFDVMQALREVRSALCSVTVVDEGLLDAVTGLSATGPAYFYYVVESLMRAGQELGLAEETCWELLVQTMYGAAKMLRETGKGPEELRRQVTSPNGTTMAGISVLEQGGFQDLLQRAVKRAAERAGEMGREVSGG